MEERRKQRAKFKVGQRVMVEREGLPAGKFDERTIKSIGFCEEFNQFTYDVGIRWPDGSEFHPCEQHLRERADASK